MRENCLEVTQVLADAIVNNRLEMIVNNDTMRTGNIFKDQQKKVMVDYSYGRAESHIEVIESHKLMLPERNIEKTLGFMP